MSTRRRTARGRAASGLLVLAIAAPAALAQLTIDRHGIDAGGGRATGGDFALHGTIAQPDAQAPMHGGDFVLQGGFWRGSGTAPGSMRLFGDGFED